MSDNGLEVRITREQFRAITDPNKKLDAMFEVLITQKNHCDKQVSNFESQFKECHKLIEKATKVPSRNRKIDFGVGSAGGVTGYVIIDKLIDIVKSYISGG